MTLLQELTSRGYVYQSTDVDNHLADALNQGPITLYAGFDPTADSLHVGHLLPIMVLRKFQAYGHTPLVLVGNGTALIGDPSGKASARKALTQAQVDIYTEAISKQLGQYFPTEAFRFNHSWLSTLNYLEFLTRVGSKVNVRHMLASDSIKQRLEESLSFLEFNYALLQAYDFYHLHMANGCTLQIGGQDQWGNMVAGTGMVRSLSGHEVHAMTIPLLLKKDGEKFGKTNDGAVWLSPLKTPPAKYYQFWRNVQDNEVVKLLKLFTDIPLQDIDKLSMLKDSDLNKAKEILAYEATKLVHGKDAAMEVYGKACAKYGKSNVMVALSNPLDID